MSDFTGKPREVMSKADDAIASALQCPEGCTIDVPISLWTPEEIEELYQKVPPNLRIDPDGRMPGCASIIRV